MALRVLYHEPRAEKERLINKENATMDWTTLWMIETVVAFLAVFALHRIWREQY
jgi:hypothetical protein